MHFIEATGKKPVLPKVPTAPVQAIDILAISKVRTANRLRQRILRARRAHQVDVVGHEAIAQYAKAEPRAVVTEEFEVSTTVVVNEENILAVVAALNHMVRPTRYDDSSYARHTEDLHHVSEKVK
jgi:hypothetical protein